MLFIVNCSQASKEEKAYQLLREWRKRKQGTVYALKTILTQAGVSFDSTPKTSNQKTSSYCAAPTSSSQPASMYIIMYVITYMYMYVPSYTCTCTCMYPLIHVHVHVCTLLYMYMYMYVPSYTYTCTCTCTWCACSFSCTVHLKCTV